MPALNQSAFHALTVLAENARAAAILAGTASVIDETAFSATAEQPEPLARLADTYITSLANQRDPFGGVFTKTRETPGVAAELVNVALLIVANGDDMDPRCGTIDKALYLA